MRGEEREIRDREREVTCGVGDERDGGEERDEIKRAWW